MATQVRVDTSTPGTPVLHFTRRYPHPRSAVWAALTTGKALSRWFPCQVEIDARQGGSLTLAFPDEEPETVPVTEFDPPRTLAFRWAGEDLRWTLEEDGDGCVLRLSNTVADPAWTANTAAGWDVCLDVLDAVLDGRPPLAGDGPDEERIAHYRTVLGTG
ncbi:ATPase [Nocardiopsis sp. TSRI0078]|uniref:SRPBCC family protein n=1 Tax=unclassified Nocardiopsis TaxID=2649073 RepID=UPI00093899D7|nr:SRPBCC family protein [Nocardiopsis sp. TSRI0078]OKI13094.1 ATPase [Nocardiopsis sp. TSRI0078]